MCIFNGWFIRRRSASTAFGANVSIIRSIFVYGRRIDERRAIFRTVNLIT